MTRHLWAKWLLLALLSLLFVVGCSCGDDDDDDDSGDDDDDDDDSDDDTADDDTADDDTGDDDDDTPSDADPYIEQGKYYLTVGAGDLASEQFRLGMAADPDHQDCWYGIMLGDTLHNFDVLSIIITYVNMIIGYQPPGQLRDLPQSGQEFIDELVGRALEGLVFENSAELVEQAQKVRDDHPDIVFDLTRMPIILAFEEVADAHGDFDLAEAVAAQSAAQIGSGLLEHLTSLNLDFNLGLIFELMEEDLGSLPFEELLGVIVDYGLLLFDDPIFPDFFTLKNNAVPFREAGLQLGLGLRNAAETYREMITETDEKDEVLGYDDTNDNGKWDEGEHLVVPPYGTLDDEQNAQAWAFAGVFDHLADSFLDYTDYDDDPNTATPFKLSYLNPLLQSFGIPGLIPDNELLQIDFGAAYRDADPDQLKNTIVLILTLLDSFLP